MHDIDDDAIHADAFQSHLLGAIEQYGADIYYYNGEISDDGWGQVVEQLSETSQSDNKRDNAILILTTYGGSADAAYKIARLFQKTYDKLYIYAPVHCYSAGTLLCLGAHSLILGPFSELGPLDVQLPKMNEIGARKSGLLAKSAFDSLADTSFELFEDFMLNIMKRSGGQVSFRLAAELSASMAIGLMSQVYNKMDPEIIGSDRRYTEVALHYGRRLVSYSENTNTSGIERLIYGYPAHDYVIDDSEACEIFASVKSATRDLGMLHALASGFVPRSGTQVISLSLLLDEHAGDKLQEADDSHHVDGGASHDAMSDGPIIDLSEKSLAAEPQADGVENGGSDDDQSGRPSEQDPGPEVKAGMGRRGSAHRTRDTGKPEQDADPTIRRR